jgi:hypothetical protein
VSKAGADWSSGGNVTTVFTYPSGDKIILLRELDTKQDADFVYGDKLPSSKLEDAVDKRAMVEQQFDERFNRVLTVPKTDPSTIDLELPNSEQRKDKYLFFDSNGEPIAQTISGISIPQATRKGWLGMTLSNFGNDTVPQIIGQAEVNGTNYELSTLTSINGTVTVNAWNYIKLIESGGTVVPTWTTTAPTWNQSKSGWYNGSDRYVAKMWVPYPNLFQNPHGDDENVISIDGFFAIQNLASAPNNGKIGGGWGFDKWNGAGFIGEGNLVNNNNTDDMHGLVAGNTYAYDFWMWTDVATPANSSIKLDEYRSGAWQTLATLTCSAASTWENKTGSIALDSSTTGFRILITIDQAEAINKYIMIDEMILRQTSPVPTYKYQNKMMMLPQQDLSSPIAMELAYDDPNAKGSTAHMNAKLLTIPIQGWNMDANQTHYITFNFADFKKATILSVEIINDAQDQPYNLDSLGTNSEPSGGWYIKSDHIYLWRDSAPSRFDSTDYNDTTINRGYIYVLVFESERRRNRNHDFVTKSPRI